MIKASINDSAFLGARISDNMAKTKEGYLICYEVPIARTGVQDYYGHELSDIAELEYNKVYKVDRPIEEVFDKRCIASFEGKPFTNNHPIKLVDVNDTKLYMAGHLQNVKPDSTNEHILADIIVMDKQTIDDIESGKREVSAGYECEWVFDNDKITQKNIRGNHVALVDKGRAGKEVCIKDEKGEKRMTTKFSIGALLKSFAKDAEPEEVEAAVKELTKSEIEEPKPMQDGLEERLAKIEATLAQLVETDKEVHEETNALDELEVETKEETKEEPKEELLEEEKEEVTDADLQNDPEAVKALGEKAQSDCNTAKDAALKAISGAKKAVASIKDRETRKIVANHFATILRGTTKNVNYTKALDAAKTLNDTAKMQRAKTQAAQDAQAQEAYKKIKENKFRK